MKAGIDLKDKLILPKGYLSWSAYTLWKRDKEHLHYIKHYFYGLPATYTNVQMRFGSTFADDHENGTSDDEITNLILGALPKTDSKEKKMDAVIPTKFGDLKLQGKIDRYYPDTHDFDELKTGTRKWTQNMANRHGQLKFYALMIFLNYKIIPKKINLVWVQTEKYIEEVETNYGSEQVEKIRLTGKVTKFPVKISMMELMQFSKELTKTAFEISEAYKKFLKENI